MRLRLLGAHQLDNAAAAVAAAGCLRRHGLDRINLTAVAAGLEAATLPGRFQVCQYEEDAEAAAQQAAMAAQGGARDVGDELGPWVVLDGAHTAESAQALAATLREVFPSAPVAVVLAMAEDKQHRWAGWGWLLGGGFVIAPQHHRACLLQWRTDRHSSEPRSDPPTFLPPSICNACREFCQQLRAIQPAVVVFTSVPIAGGAARAAGPGQLAGAWQAAGMLGGGRAIGGVRTRELIQASLTAAVEKGRMELRAHRGQGRGVVLVCGSLHAVGAALSQLPLVPC